MKTFLIFTDFMCATKGTDTDSYDEDAKKCLFVESILLI